MRHGFFIALGLMLAGAGAVHGADPVPPAPAAERVEAPAPPAPAVAPAPRPAAEAPKPVVKPKPVEKPRPAAEPSRAVEPAVPVVAPMEPSVAPPPEACSYSIGCLALAFAMLIAGFAAGFIARHLVSRRQLGGMTVRIGTWRGIP